MQTSDPCSLLLFLMLLMFNTVKLKPVKSKHNDSKNLYSLQSASEVQLTIDLFQTSDLYIGLMFYTFITFK